MLRLASGSPRRVELLRLAGLDLAVSPADVDEAAFAAPAVAKAAAVRRRGEVTLAVDTEIELDGVRVGKPATAGEAVTMLADLVERGVHDVRSEVAVVDAAGRARRFGVTTRVVMRAASLREIERYVATGEPFGKAGGYAIQGEGARLVGSFDGCFANVTGLPLCHVYAALRRAGVATRERPERVCPPHFDFTCPVWRAAQRQGRALHDGAEFDSWNNEVARAVGGAVPRAPGGVMP